MGGTWLWMPSSVCSKHIGLLGINLSQKAGVVDEQHHVAVRSSNMRFHPTHTEEGRRVGRGGGWDALSPRWVWDDLSLHARTYKETHIGTPTPSHNIPLGRRAECESAMVKKYHLHQIPSVRALAPKVRDNTLFPGVPSIRFSMSLLYPLRHCDGPGHWWSQAVWSTPQNHHRGLQRTLSLSDRPCGVQDTVMVLG